MIASKRLLDKFKLNLEHFYALLLGIIYKIELKKSFYRKGMCHMVALWKNCLQI